MVVVVVVIQSRKLSDVSRIDENDDDNVEFSSLSFEIPISISFSCCDFEMRYGDCGNVVMAIILPLEQVKTIHDVLVTSSVFDDDDDVMVCTASSTLYKRPCGANTLMGTLTNGATTRREFCTVLEFVALRILLLLLLLMLLPPLQYEISAK